MLYYLTLSCVKFTMKLFIILVESPPNAASTYGFGAITTFLKEVARL
jgi:hypothetical protein